MIFNTIDDLKSVVKINAASSFNNWQIYITDAQDRFLTHYLGAEIIEKLNDEELEAPYKKLLPYVQKTLGPFAVALATDEMSLMIGDGGHSVLKTETFTPASDAKIKAAKHSLFSRAYNNLELLIQYLEQKTDIYPEWKDTKFYSTRHTAFFKSAVDFQEQGLLDISFSRLTFEKIRPLILRIEKSELSTLIPKDIIKMILDYPGDELLDDTDIYIPDADLLEDLKIKIQALIGARVGELYTSKNTKNQRQSNGEPEYIPVIRPLYSDPSDELLNFYSAQVAFWRGQILDLLPELGIDLGKQKLNWDNEGKHVFSSLY